MRGEKAMKTYSIPTNDNGTTKPFKDISVGDFFLTDDGENCYIKVSSSMAFEPALHWLGEVAADDEFYIPTEIIVVSAGQE